MYIYFDENGTIKEVVNDKSIRQGSNEANKLYCYIEGNPSIDDIWYLQKNVDGSLTNEISFKNSTVTKAIPYDAKRDMRYFKDFETYNFYVFTLTTNYLKQSGLVSGTIRIEVDNEIFALGELKFNVQENVINTSNNITQSQYDYLLLAYASRTLNEETGSDLDHLLDEKIDAKLGDIADGSPRVFDTTAHIQALTSDMGLAVATDTGYIWVWNDTDSEYVNTNYQYLNDASNIVYHTGNVLEDGNGNTIYPEIADGSINTDKLDNALFDLLLKYSDIVDITSSFPLVAYYLDKANGNSNPDANSRSTGFIDLSLYTEFLISGYSQYATCMICTYDENQQFLRAYCEGGSGGATYTDYRFIPQSDEKYVKFGTYQYTTHPLVIKSVGQVTSIANEKQWNVLYGKKYVACGDSFTKGDVIASDKVYPYLIAQRNNMNLVNMSANGSYAHYGADGFTNPNNSYYYQNIPLDADYITIAYGLNEISTPLGTKDSVDNTTIWGAYNEILSWIISNIPNAKVGIISNDAWMTYELRNTLQEIASYYGVTFLDLKEYGQPMMISGKYTEDGAVNTSIKNARTTQYCVSNVNGHPNQLGHLVRSYLIENFLRNPSNSSNCYTKKEIQTFISALQPLITNSNKLSSDLVDDAGNTNKFVTASEKAQITTNATDIDKLQMEVANLKTAVEGNLYNETTDNNIAYEVALSNPLPYGKVNKVGGMSYKSENLFNPTAETITYGGITYTISSDGTVTINGTSTTTIMIITQANLPAGTYTWALFNSSTCYNSSLSPLDDNLRMELRDGGVIASSQVYSDNTNKTKTFTTTSTATSIYIRIGSGVTINNFTFKPMLVSGSTAPSEFKPYFEGIRDSAVSQLIVKDSNNVTKSTKTIPSEIQALTGYGWGISESVCNYIDFDNKKYIQMVGRVDMGTLSWELTTRYFRAVPIPTVKYVAGGSIPNLLTTMYTVSTPNDLYNQVQDNLISTASTSTQIWVRDTSCSNTSELTTKLSGIYLYYELETPIETDVSQYLTDENYDVLSNLEPNGSITLDNTYQQEAVYDITTLEKVSV